MSGLDFDDIHGDIAPALAEMSRLLRVVPLTSEPAARGTSSPCGGFAPAGEDDHMEKLA